MNLATRVPLRSALFVAGAATAMLSAAVVLAGRVAAMLEQAPAPHVIAVSVARCPVSAPVAPPAPLLVRLPVASDLDAYRARLAPRAYAGAPLVATIATSLGTLHCRLEPRTAPLAVASFVGLASGLKPWRDPRTGSVVERPFYDGLTFHRVIPDFVIQGGDPTGTGAGGPGYAFVDEIAPDQHFRAGDLAMANAGPNTNGSQFFITDGAPTWLDGHYTIFGHCAERDVVQRIARVRRGDLDRPTQPVTIEHVAIAWVGRPRVVRLVQGAHAPVDPVAPGH